MIIPVSVFENETHITINRFPVEMFRRDLFLKYRSNSIMKIFEEMFYSFLTGGSLMFNKFFAPEVFYLLKTIRRTYTYDYTANKMLENTWLKNITDNKQSRVDLNVIQRDLSFTSKDYQLEFIKNYDLMKQRYMLNGYLLAFDPGLGKTYTSIALMHGLHKKSILIICPKNIIQEVWEREINRLFHEKQDIWTIGQPLRKARFYILNYEALPKISALYDYFEKHNDLGIIIDESHNFRSQGAKRAVYLQQLASHTECKDILFMSGTPIKALGSEMIPMLHVLDPLFNENARKSFIKAFGINKSICNDILQHRLGIMMYRKRRGDVIKLPEKIEKNINISFPESKKYTITKVKEQIIEFREQREAYYKEHGEKYHKDFEICIDFLKTKFNESEVFQAYLEGIERLKKEKFDTRNRELRELVIFMNKYEKEVLYPALPNDLKQKFKKSKSVVKYIHLKILGEILGGLLSRLRKEMTIDILKNSGICGIIKNAEKKSVCFTTYVDVVDYTAEYVARDCGLDPLIVHGNSNEDVLTTINQFKKNPKMNPLIATIQSLATGVTLNEANVIIFINQPWRSVDKDQAIARSYRIGQESTVYVYNYILDTGDEPNLSTRMEDIINWSKEQFSEIVGDDYPEK